MVSINLTPNPRLQVKTTKIVGDFHDYLIRKGDFITSQRSMQTENINSCTAGVLCAGEKHFMFHAAPEMQPLNTIKKELEAQVENLKKYCDDIRGFICGGWELNTKNPESVKSFDLYTSIADTLDDLGVKFSMLCGKEKGAPFENLHSINKNITCWSDTFKNIIVGDKSKMSQNQIADMLENHYQFVELNPEDTIKLTGEAIRNAEALAC